MNMSIEVCGQCGVIGCEMTAKCANWRWSLYIIFFDSPKYQKFKEENMTNQKLSFPKSNILLETKTFKLPPSENPMLM